MRSSATISLSRRDGVFHLDQFQLDRFLYRCPGRLRLIVTVAHPGMVSKRNKHLIWPNSVIRHGQAKFPRAKTNSAATSKRGNRRSGFRRKDKSGVSSATIRLPYTSTGSFAILMLPLL